MTFGDDAPGLHSIEDNIKDNNDITRHVLPEEQEPLNKDEEDDTTETKTSKERESIIRRIQHDRIFRNKFITTVILWWSFISLGWLAAQGGPTFLDLQRITSSSLDKASAFMTSGAIGYLVGSSIAGFLFNRINRSLFLMVVCVGIAATTIVIPWCYIYEVMILIQLLRGVFGGMQDSAGNAELLRTWGSENKPYMQALHFFFAFGGIVSPIATAPFLSTTSWESEITNQTINSNATDEFIRVNETVHTSGTTIFTTTFLNQTLSHNSSVSDDYRNSSAGSDDGSDSDSSFYIAFLITSIFYLVSASLFLISFFITSKRKESATQVDEKKPEHIRHKRKLPIVMKVIVLINVSLLMLLYCAIEESFASFLTAFVVKQLHWTKTSGAYATSIFWASFCTGRFLGIFLINCMKPFVMILSCFALLHIVHIGIILSSIFFFDAGIFIFSAVAGISMSVVFPTIFSWTDDQLLPVSGRVVSLIMVSAAVGAMVNPLVMGYFIDNVAALFFSYLPLGQCVTFTILFLVAFCLSRKIKRYQNSTNFNNVEIEVGTELS